MPDTLTFLIVDDNLDGRFLLFKTLKRKFPGSIILECSETETALTYFKAHRFAAVVVHRAADADTVPVVEIIRAMSKVPIIVVSGYDRTDKAMEAGATAFLHYDAWLRIGTVVDESLKSAAAASPGS